MDKKIYVMADLHGHFKEFMKMLDKIEFKDDDYLYILGDVIDRGKDSIKLLEYIIQQSNIELILGNHEELMVEAIKTNDMTLWFRNGGKKSYQQFRRLTKIKQQQILDYLKSRPLYKVIDKYIMVHAGIKIGYFPIDPINQFMQFQTKDDLLWSREDFYNNKSVEDYTVIFGHTPTYYIDRKLNGKIWHDTLYSDKICIDCGVILPKDMDGMLGVLRLNDMMEFYINPYEVK